MVSTDIDKRQLVSEVETLRRLVAELEELQARRKLTEEKMRQAAEEWRTTFDSITDLVFIADRDFRLVRVNKACANLFKMKPQELIGKTCYEVVHGTREPVPDCPHKLTLETKKPATAEFLEPQLGIYLQVSTSPIFYEEGEVAGSVHIMKDITERKQIEEALRESERKYRHFVENAQESIMALDAEAKVTFVNPQMAEMLGYTVEEMLGKSLFSFMDERGREIVTKQIERRRRGMTDRYDAELIRKDGTRLYASVRATPITNDSGEYIGSFAFIGDITESKRAEAALRESEKRYRTIFESANDVFLLINKKGKIVDVNERLKALGGYDREELVGRNVRSLTKMMTKKSLAIILKNFAKRMAGFNTPPTRFS